MPQAPQLEGLPLALQIALSIAFVAITAFVALKGYLPKPKEPAEGSAQIIGAQFADMGAIRRLGEICIQLGAQVGSLEDAIREQTHWVREGNELTKTTVDRLREFHAECEVERRVAERLKHEG